MSIVRSVMLAGVLCLMLLVANVHASDVAPAAAVENMDEKAEDGADGGLDPNQKKDQEEDEELRLFGYDQKEPFTITKKLAKNAAILANILEGDEDANDIILKKLDHETLGIMVDYLNTLDDDRVPAEILKPIRSTSMEKIADPIDAKFILDVAEKYGITGVFNVILGANYMDIPSLLHLACAYIATLIKGKSPDQIKQVLGSVTKDDGKKVPDEKDDRFDLDKVDVARQHAMFNERDQKDADEKDRNHHKQQADAARDGGN